MIGIIIEIFWVIVLGLIVWFLIFNPKIKEVRTVRGWKFFTGGFCLLFFGALIDNTDSFEALNRFIIIGKTPYQAFIEDCFGFLFGFIFIAIGIWLWIPSMIELQNKLKKEIDEAKQKNKILSELLPFCSSCKKTRDDKGYWNQIELYIDEHSDAKFTHGICPECAKRLYPEEFEDEG